MMRSYLRRLYRLLFAFLNSRGEFKLFLNAALGDIDLRMLALASEIDYFAGFVRPVPVRAPFGRSVLVVAPHQDDEAIGCGGALLLQVRAGRDAAVVVLQDGADGHEELGMTREQMSAIRNDESRRAASVAGLTDAPVFLNHARLENNVARAAAEMAELIRARKVDAVFVPFALDANFDHRCANEIVAEALRGVSWNVRVFGYEVWGLCIPNVIVVIDDVIEKKMEMISSFSFANSAIDYVQSTRGLNMFHSRMLGAGQAKYVERFFELPREEYIQLVDRLQATAARLTAASANAGRP
ncbi:MAG TPA: PIG-L family deacetylase [Bryobacteraceae bacterium]|nr:PIG-L family deacetylase [Bryobacteraceae bacterium]